MSVTSSLQTAPAAGLNQVRFSRYGGASTEPSPVNRMMASFARDFRDGVDVNLGVGYINERTIPIPQLEEALRAVIGDCVRYRQAFNYGGPEGSPNLIRSIGDFLVRTGRLDRAALDRKRLMIGPCGATSILDGIAEILAPGIVVTADPVYYVYANSLHRRGLEIVAAPEDAEGIQLDALARKLEALGRGLERLSFLYIVTVNNPSCAILSNCRRRALVEFVAGICRRAGRRIPIFFDQAYEFLLHDPAAERFQSAMPDDELDIVYEIGTLSKVLAPALRAGYLLGPRGPLMNAMVQKTSDAGFSASLFAQEMASYMLDRHIDGQLERVNAGYREKALALRAGIHEILGPYLRSSVGGSAGFYFYLTFDRVETHADSPFFRFLTRTTGDPAVDGPPGDPRPRVIYVPGEYCVHPTGDLVAVGRRQLRLSYGYEETAAILRALALMREAAEYALRC
ncbi:MAG: pyridoxal phosphate-dependent aminotransferase [Bryobacteraceae bacterium]|nr:pyridoxal phosphate-dependent aminotransferase [Bryobacteraceae bacterium]